MKNNVLNILKKSLFLLMLVPCMFIFTSCGSTSAYEVAKENGFSGTEQEWLNSLKGKSAYEIACDNGFVGTEQEWLNSLKGHDGTNGEDGSDAPVLNTYEMYQNAIKPENGFNGTYLEFLKTLSGNNLDVTPNILSKNFMSVLTVNAFRSGSTNGTTGSAVLYKYNADGSAYLITNRHVTAYSSTQNYAIYNVYLANSNYRISATYVGGSMDHDIAVLKVADSSDLKSANVEPVVLSDHKLGEDCYSIGDNLGAGMAITKGIVCTDSEDINMEFGNSVKTIRAFRHDSYINHGNSGGGLFNSKGELIGLTNGGAKEITDLRYYAVPSSIIEIVAENIIEDHEANSGSGYSINLGITTQAYAHTSYYDPNTSTAVLKEIVKIKSIATNSIVNYYNQTCGNNKTQLKVGDTLVSLTINGKKYNITRTFNLNEYMLSARIGDVIIIEAKNSAGTYTAEISLNSTYISPLI